MEPSEPTTLPTTLSELTESDVDWENAPQVTVTCPECKKDHWHNKYLAAIFPNALCDGCSNAYDGRTGGNPYPDPIHDTQSLPDTCMPSLYLSTDPTRIPPPQLHQVTSWQPNPIGLWIRGDTRTFKTRSVCELIKALLHTHKVTTFFHGEFNDQILDVMRSEQSFRKFKRKLSTTPILFIDDLFSSKLTERAESTLFEIMDARISNQLPTLVTTQATKNDCRKIFANPKRLDALFERVNEFFTIINTNAFAKQANLKLSK